MTLSTKLRAEAREAAPLRTPTDLGGNAAAAVATELNKLVADAFALYLKTKNFHWHVSGAHFRDYHLLFDEQAAQVFASIDPLAERVRKLGQTTLRSIGEIARLKSVADDDRSFVSPEAMIAELVNDNKAMAAAMRHAHGVCDGNNDVASASLLETLIDETERRVWFLFETGRKEA